MARNQGRLLLLAGAALLLVSGGKKKRVVKIPTPSNGASDEDMDEQDVDSPAATETTETFEKPASVSPQDILAKYLSQDGRARMGMLYQIMAGDTPLSVCREALFGTREVSPDPAMRNATMELLIRIDCGPWNQAVAGVPLSELKNRHAEIDSYFTQKGVSFNPIYQDNVARILNNLAPTSEPGHSFALIWIPMINIDKLDLEGIVTTEGMYHPDTASGIGGSMIDPPEAILALDFDETSSDEVGCNLPEGDFRKTLHAI